ncbi:copper resistance protein CopC [Streptosporangium lutulentum]
MARWLDRLLVLTLVAGVALTALTTPAAAHGQLVVSTPAKDSTVSTPLESLALYFTEKPSADAYFTLTAPSGVRVDRPWSHGEPIRLDEPVQEYTLINGVWEPSLYHTGFPAKVPVAHWPERGLYVARYQSVASDGEAVQGRSGSPTRARPRRRPRAGRPPPTRPTPPCWPRSATAAPPRPGRSGPPRPSPRRLPYRRPGRSPRPPHPRPDLAGAPTDSGTGVMVWLLPAVLVAGVGVMVVRAARRPRPRERPGRIPPGPGRERAQRAAPPRKARRTKAAKRR